MAELTELVFFPTPAVGHLVSLVELANLLVQRDPRISITILMVNVKSDHFNTPSLSSLSLSVSENIRFIDLPHVGCDPYPNPTLGLDHVLRLQKPHVKEAMQKLLHRSDQPYSFRLAGFVVDLFCTAMIDVADELGVPSYVYCPSGAAFLNLCFYLQNLHDNGGRKAFELKGSNEELLVPGLVNPVPAKVLPWVMIENEEVAEGFIKQVRRMKEAKGILVNTFAELESYAVDSFCDDILVNTFAELESYAVDSFCDDDKLPPLYPVGPILKKSKDDTKHESNHIFEWLDDQSPSSVMFLCFGSMGSFHEEQIKEIAYGLENSRYRFLWCLRQGVDGKDKFVMPSDYSNTNDVLPDGFLERTAEIGRVIGWVSQVDVLAHPAIAGFVSHCGWNSCLETIKFGVPVATWPLYAEQQFNAFSLLKEFGLAAEIKMDYRKDFVSDDTKTTISAEEIERGIRCLMELGDDKRRKVKEMSEKSKEAMEEGGSSYVNLGRFIDDMVKNMTSNLYSLE